MGNALQLMEVGLQDKLTKNRFLKFEKFLYLSLKLWYNNIVLKRGNYTLLHTQCWKGVDYKCLI